MKLSIIFVALFATLGIATLVPAERDNTPSIPDAARDRQKPIPFKRATIINAERKLAAREAISQKLTNAERIQRGLPLAAPVRRSPDNVRRQGMTSCNVCKTPSTAFCSAGSCACPNYGGSNQYGFDGYSRIDGCQCHEFGYIVSKNDPSHCCGLIDRYYRDGSCHFLPN